MSFPEHVAPFRLEDMTRPVSPEPPPHSRRRRPMMIAAIGVALVLLLGGGVTYYLLSRPGPQDPLSTANLVTACQEATKRQLKSPASAKFSDETTSALSETRMRVWGVVDAQNGFGAQLRERYTCEADRGDKMWLVQSVVFANWP